MVKMDIMRLRLSLICILFSISVSAQELIVNDWTKYFYESSAISLLKPFSLVLDSEGNCYVGISANQDIVVDSTIISGIESDDFGVILKFNNEGELLWDIKYYDILSIGYGGVTLYELQIDNDDNLIVAGVARGAMISQGHYYVNATEPGYKGFIHKINPAGENIVFEDFDSIYVYDLAIGPNNEISGLAKHTGTSDNFFGELITSKQIVFNCDDSLQINFLLQQNIPDNGQYVYSSSKPVLSKIVANQEGEIFVSYNFTGTLELNGNTYSSYEYYTVSIDSYMVDEDSFEVIIDTSWVRVPDAIVVKYDANGNEMWHYTFAGFNTQVFSALTLNDDGNAFLIGMAFEGDTVYLQDNQDTIIMPSYPQFYWNPYLILELDTDGGLVNYTFLTDTIYYDNELLVTGDDLYVPGKLNHIGWDVNGAALGRYDADFNLKQFGQATCAYSSPCDVNSHIALIAVHDSSIFVVGSIYENAVWGDDTLTHSNNIFFLSKLPYDFSETLIEPVKEIVEYTDTHIFPIPASNELHINLPEVDLELPFCMITNSLGQQWTFIPEKLNVNNWVVDIHQLRRGVYFITYITNDKINTHTFVKM